jgi:hypothetical protein
LEFTTLDDEIPEARRSPVQVEFTTGKGRERVRVLGTLEFTTLDDEVSQAHRDQDLDHTIKPRH